MPKEEWGLKHHCAGCGTKFYDLVRDPISCPKCGKIVEFPEARNERDKIDDMEAKRDKPRETASSGIGDDDAVLGEDHDADVDLVDSVLDDEGSDTVSLEDIADVPKVDES
ncbi:MAG: TIGR02300 family protein [Albidovulum sp.]|nr:TIGR02300 family protein [Albidovulum sp.]